MNDPNQIRINELARELEVKFKAIIDYLPEIGVAEKKTHSSSVDLAAAEKVRKHFRELADAEAAAEAAAAAEKAAQEAAANTVRLKPQPVAPAPAAGPAAPLAAKPPVPAAVPGGLKPAAGGIPAAKPPIPGAPAPPAVKPGTTPAAVKPAAAGQPVAKPAVPGPPATKPAAHPAPPPQATAAPKPATVVTQPAAPPAAARPAATGARHAPFAPSARPAHPAQPLPVAPLAPVPAAMPSVPTAKRPSAAVPSALKAVAAGAPVAKAAAPAAPSAPAAEPATLVRPMPAPQVQPGRPVSPIAQPASVPPRSPAAIEQCYYDAAIGNLKTLAVIALVHPRLALANIPLEIELIYYDINAEKIRLRAKQRQKDKPRQYADDSGWMGPRPRAETEVIKRDLRLLMNRGVFSKNAKACIGELLSKGGGWRHHRSKVNTSGALEAVQDAKTLIAELRDQKDPDPIVCKCGVKTDFLFRRVFDALPGKQIEHRCSRSKCDRLLFHLDVPNPTETLQPFWTNVNLIRQCLSERLSEEDFESLRKFFEANLPS